MAEIIGPDGKTYFSEDHFKTKTTAATKTKEKAKNILSSFDLHTLTDRVYLI